MTGKEKRPVVMVVCWGELFQDTILALQSLSEFARLAFSKTFDIQLTVTAGTFSRQFSVSRNNALVLQSADVSRVAACGLV